MEGKNLENENVDENLNPDPQESSVQQLVPQEADPAPVDGASQIEFDEENISQNIENIKTQEDPNKKTRKRIIVGVIIFCVLFVIIIVAISSLSALSRLNEAEERIRDTEAIKSLSSSVIAVIICNEEGKKIPSPSNDGLICGFSRWPNLSEYGATWGGCDEDMDLSDKAFQYCAKTSSGRLIKCTLKNGCEWHGK